jgi:hypothetical protein
MRMLSALCIALFLTFAAAMSLPSDADIVVIANDGTIVGIGKTVGAVTFELELLAGFEGFASLVIVTPEGDTYAFAVMISDGSLYVDLVDLADIVREAGFTDHRVFADDVSARPDVAGRPDDVGRGADAAADAAEVAHEGMGNASETGREHAGDAPNEAAYGGAGNAGDAGDAADPDDLPVPPVAPPFGGHGGGRP